MDGCLKIRCVKVEICSDSSLSLACDTVSVECGAPKDIMVNETLPDSFDIQLSPNDVRKISYEYPWIPKRCEYCHIFGHTIDKCSRTAQQNHGHRAANKNRAGIDARGFQNRGNNAIRRDFGIDRGNNTVMYDGNGPGEDKTRRVWILRANVHASEGAGTSCVRNEQGEPSIPNDTGTSLVSGDAYSEGIQADDAQQDTEEEENTGDQVAVYNGTNTAESSGSRFAILNDLDLLESGNELGDRLKLGSELIIFQDQVAIAEPIQMGIPWLTVEEFNEREHEIENVLSEDEISIHETEHFNNQVTNTENVEPQASNMIMLLEDPWFANYGFERLAEKMIFLLGLVMSGLAWNL
ncbi:hypothetical protein IFM89_001352 [Coptis chinensis]|uniref:Zinc knuckle CX2CX4HX4C domain-containing protein n=1 Tax=Coptis chinensis TaxID=261450 RepID=A0A835HEX6_9MAGN|nr:hypothetical protein IFM89_001352 [Coptis chinensis]